MFQGSGPAVRYDSLNFAGDEGLCVHGTKAKYDTPYEEAHECGKAGNYSQENVVELRVELEQKQSDLSSSLFLFFFFKSFI